MWYWKLTQKVGPSLILTPEGKEICCAKDIYSTGDETGNFISFGQKFHTNFLPVIGLAYPDVKTLLSVLGSPTTTSNGPRLRHKKENKRQRQRDFALLPFQSHPSNSKPSSSSSSSSSPFSTGPNQKESSKFRSHLFNYLACQYV
ncbi:hypothetical protein VNO80_29765 [Phaseolus coccineus]|uniref:Uncharacterized protein n=1 Tax=Phaseolus coccineus TaxID=3886 RepID=A0AAN9QCS0_PHACN